MKPRIYDLWQRAKNWLADVVGQSSPKSSPDMLDFLCIDDDMDFGLYLRKLAKPYHINLHLAGSVSEAKQVINQFPYFQAFIVDGHLPDGSGFELIAWIRQEKHLDVPIGFLSRIYHDAKSFRLLKETLQVNCVLDKPLKPEEVRQLFKQLSTNQSSLSLNPPQLDEILAEIKDEYRKSIYSKIERLEEFILNVQKKSDVSSLQELKVEVHKLAGSSGSYGYPKVSEICKIMEIELIKQIDLAKYSKPSPQFINSLDEFFTQVKMYFQMISSQEIEEEAIIFPLSIKRPSVYIVDSDVDFLKSIEAEKQNRGFNLASESNPEKAKELLASPDFNPQIILVNMSYANSSLTGYDLINAAKQNRSIIAPSIGILIEKGLFEEAAHIIERGIHYVIQKSTAAFLLKLLEGGLQIEKLQRFRVLIVDDDPDVCQYLMQSLKDMGIEVQVFESNTNIQDVVARYQPDLILLDLDLLEQVTPLQAIRVKVVDQNLAIVAMTVPYEPTLVEKAYMIDIDDVIFKPLDHKILQKKVLDLVQGQSQYLSLIERDPLTGLFNYMTFENYLRKRFLRAKDSQIVASVALMSVKDFSYIEQNYPSSTVEDLLRAIADYIKQTGVDCDGCAYLGRGTFGAFVEGRHLYLLQRLIKNFLARMQPYLQSLMALSEPIVLCAGMASLPQHDDHSFDLVLKRAWEALRNAQNESSSSLVRVVALTGDYHYPVLNPEVMFISQDQHLFHDWISAFKRQNFKIKLESMGKETLKDLMSLNNPYLLPLIIFADQPVDMNVIEIIQRLKSYYPLKIPLIALNQKPSKDDLWQGLEAIDFFEKPFGMVLFLAT